MAKEGLLGDEIRGTRPRVENRNPLVTSFGYFHQEMSTLQNSGEVAAAKKF
jgi:hypothetical protein